MTVNGNGEMLGNSVANQLHGCGLETVTPNLQLMHGRLSTLILGLRSQHPMLKDCFARISPMSAVVIDVLASQKLQQDLHRTFIIGKNIAKTKENQLSPIVLGK